MGVIGEFELLQRRRLISLANEILNTGAHYLWGAQGHAQMCANHDGANEQEKRLFTASLHGSTTYVCAGRPNAPSVRRLPQRNALEQANQLASNAGDYRWARYYRDGDTVHPSPSELVYGESCIGKMHFDCAGFVRYCYRQTLNRAMPSQMRNTMTLVWNRDRDGGNLGDIDIYPGDVLYGGGHVGLATGKTEYGAALPEHTIHAYYSKEGVVSTAITARPNWSEVRRWTQWEQPFSGGWGPSAMA